MKKIIVIVSVVILAGLYTYSHFERQSGRQEVITDLPWLITINEQGLSTVFGQTLGQSSLQDLVMHAGRDAEIRLFQNKDGSYALEAFLEYVNLGNIVSKLIVQLNATETELDSLKQKAIKDELGPSLARKYSFSPEDEAPLMLKTISSLTYTPMYVRLTEEMIAQRFGAPVQTLDIDEETRHLLYPELGLDIFMNQRGKTVFQYVNPADFQHIRDSLERAIEAAAED